MKLKCTVSQEIVDIIKSLMHTASHLLKIRFANICSCVNIYIFIMRGFFSMLRIHSSEKIISK
jgi:hypothetical protein